MSKMSQHYLDTLPEQLASAVADLGYTRYEMRRVALRLDTIRRAMGDPATCLTSDMIYELFDLARDLRAVAGPDDVAVAVAVADGIERDEDF